MPRDSNGVYRSARGSHGIGKVLGKNKWVHTSALDAILPEEQAMVQKAMNVIGRPLPLDVDIVVKVNLVEGIVTFSESPDWKTATEPALGKIIGIKRLNTKNPVVFTMAPARNPFIYYHKWMFVKDDYTGFDVQKSMRWSETWENSDAVRKLNNDRNEHFRLKIGKADYWREKVLARDDILS